MTVPVGDSGKDPEMTVFAGGWGVDKSVKKDLYGSRDDDEGSRDDDELKRYFPQTLRSLS